MDLVSMNPSIAVDPSSGPSREAYEKFLQGKSPEELRWWTKDTVAVVTGANKGIGLETVRQLASGGMTIILTARDERRGLAAVDSLKAKGLENVLFHELDVTKPESAASLASWIREKFGGFDILVGNAGVASREETYDAAKFIIDTNYFGQKIVVSALLPLLRPSPAGARIIFVSSELGQLQYLQSEKLRQQLNDVDHLTEEDVDKLAEKFLEDVKPNPHNHWAIGLYKPYKVSKILLNAYGRLLAKSLSDRPAGKKIYVNLMTPGLTSTDLTGNFPGARTVEQAADTIVWLAQFPSGGPDGGFLRDRADCPWLSVFCTNLLVGS